MKRSPENTLMSPDSSPGSADGVTAYPASDKDRADMLALLRDPNFRMSGGSQFALEIVTALGVTALDANTKARSDADGTP